MSTAQVAMEERHPKGLYVLFLTEMWERFSFYSMVAMFTLYLQNKDEGFSWTKAEATSLYSNYMMFVYLSPFLGGWLADWRLGYRRSVMIGGVFFMAGHLLLAFRDLAAVYAALTCLVIGNGFFKPNVSTMVGNLYSEGSPLKERAYNIFYLGINIGAFAAPIMAEFVSRWYGFHVAFTVAAFGMLISVTILWWFKQYVEDPKTPKQSALPGAAASSSAMDLVPEWKRVSALVVVFAVVIVFWMAFHQGGSTITYWADENTDWNVSGIISNSINAFWVLALTFPLIWFWNWLASKGLEPSTPAKMAIGMFLTAASFGILYLGALSGESTLTGDNRYAFKVSPFWLISAYCVLTLGELMLSPMGLALVAKVAPFRLRGVMMGGWFVATGIGNKLTMIGVYWEEWLHSTFWAVLGLMSLGMAVVLLVLLRPLKKAMPGV